MIALLNIQKQLPIFVVVKPWLFFFSVLKVITALGYDSFHIYKNKLFVGGVFVHLHDVCTRFKYFCSPGWNFYKYKSNNPKPE